jgi:uncharacterized protein YecE (DUF72 family)
MARKADAAKAKTAKTKTSRAKTAKVKTAKAKAISTKAGAGGAASRRTGAAAAKTAKTAARPASATVTARAVPHPGAAGAHATAAARSAGQAGHVYLGVGGWTFPPWRGVFYPDKLPHAQELAYAATKLGSIEINGTYYGTQKPESFRKWASEVPDGFKFSVKGPRFATNRRVLAEAGDSIRRFYDSGVTELGDRLGPVLWQFAPTKKFDEADFGHFLELLPNAQDGLTLRHVVEVRHDSFRTPAFIALLRRFKVPVVFAEHATYPQIADLTGDFVYARLQKGKDSIATGYPADDLDAWARRLKLWAEGGEPDDLPKVEDTAAPRRQRDVFAYVIHEGKIRAPAAAMALMERLA